MKPLTVLLLAAALYGASLIGASIIQINQAGAACPAHDLKCKESEAEK